MSLAATMTGIELILIYPGDGRGRIEHKFNPRIEKATGKGECKEEKLTPRPL